MRITSRCDGGVVVVLLLGGDTSWVNGSSAQLAWRGRGPRGPCTGHSGNFDSNIPKPV